MPKKLDEIRIKLAVNRNYIHNSSKDIINLLWVFQEGKGEMQCQYTIVRSNINPLAEGEVAEISFESFLEHFKIYDFVIPERDAETIKRVIE